MSEREREYRLGIAGIVYLTLLRRCGVKNRVIREVAL